MSKKEHEFLFSDLNKTIKAIRAIADENLILKAKIKETENILNYSLNYIISSYKTGNMTKFKCEICNTEYLILGEKVSGKIYNIFCTKCHTLRIFDRKPIILIQL